MKIKVLKPSYIVVSAVFIPFDIWILVICWTWTPLVSVLEFRILLWFLSVAFLLSTVKFIYDSIFGCYSHTLVMDEQGITYFKRKQSWFLRWEDINYIQIVPNRYGRMNKSAMICFNGGDLMLDSKIRGVKDFSETIFGVQFRDSIITEIRKHTDLPIQGIYQVTGKSI